MPSNSILELNVGGQLFQTNIQTLCKYPDSMLCAMFSHTDSGLIPMTKTEKGYFFLDVNPIYFGVVLDWLRLGKVTFDNPGLLKGTMALAEYFGLDKLTEELKVIDKKNKLPSLTLRTVTRSYETVDETVKDNVCHLEEALLKKDTPSRIVMLKHLRNAIKLSSGYAINKLAAKMFVDECSIFFEKDKFGYSKINDFTIAYYFNTIKEFY